MVQAAHKGLFSVVVDLSAKHGTVGFFRNPEVQDWIGDAMEDEGISTWRCVEDAARRSLLARAQSAHLVSRWCLTATRP